MTTDAVEPIGPEARWALAATCVAVFAVAVDFTAPTVALTSIERELDSDLSTVQWVLNGYSLTLAVLIVLAGRLADMHGRRRQFFLGAGTFAVASLAAALAPWISVLLVARVVMATGAALMWPAVLGMTFQALPAGRRALAGGLVIGVAGVGNAVGPLIGGALTEGASWRLVFAVNIPLALLAIWLTKRYVHQPFERDPDARLDPGGVALLAVGLVALLLALDFAADGNLVRPISLALLVLFVLMVVAFVAVERRVGERALLPRDVMGDRTFRATCVAGIFMSIPLFSVMLFLPQYFSKVQGYGAFEAGVALLPLMVSFALTSFVAAANIDRVDRWLLASIGAAAQCIGIFMLSFLDRSDTYVERARRHGRARHRHRPVQLGRHGGRRHLAPRVAVEPRWGRAVHVPGRRGHGGARPHDGRVRPRVASVTAVGQRPAGGRGHRPGAARSAGRPRRNAVVSCRPTGTAIGCGHRGGRRHRCLRRRAAMGVPPRRAPRGRRRRRHGAHGPVATPRHAAGRSPRRRPRRRRRASLNEIYPAGVVREGGGMVQHPRVAAALLLCTDGSDLALTALARGLEVVMAHERVVVATVVSITHPGDVLGTGMAGGVISAETARAQDQAAEQAGQVMLEETCRRLGLDGVETAILHGPAGPALCQLAADLPADVVVMGTRGLGGLRRAVLGSVSDHVVRNASCPVVVCPVA